MNFKRRLVNKVTKKTCRSNSCLWMDGRKKRVQRKNDATLYAKTTRTQ